MAHQRYVDLVVIILLFRTNLHALALHKAQTYSTYALDTFVDIVDFLGEDVDPIDEFLVHRLQIRLLSLLRFEHVFEVLRH